jgi:hypothetical protein
MEFWRTVPCLYNKSSLNVAVAYACNRDLSSRSFCTRGRSFAGVGVLAKGSTVVASRHIGAQCIRLKQEVKNFSGRIFVLMKLIGFLK